jgi:hypothetical protein
MLITCQNRDVKPLEGVIEIDQKGIVKGLKIKERRRGRYRMVVGFTITCAISAYGH